MSHLQHSPKITEGAAVIHFQKCVHANGHELIQQVTGDSLPCPHYTLSHANAHV